MKDGLEDGYELIVRLIGVIIGKWEGTEERRGGRGEAEIAGEMDGIGRGTNAQGGMAGDGGGERHLE